MKIVTYLGESGLLIHGVGEIYKHKAKIQKPVFLSMFLGILADTKVIGNKLAGKPKIPVQGVIRTGEGKVRIRIFNATSSFIFSYRIWEERKNNIKILLITENLNFFFINRL